MTIRTMRRWIICCIAIMAMAHAAGQEQVQEQVRKVTVMPRLGMTASTMWGKQATGSRLRVGAVAGVDVEYRFSPKWGVQLGVEGLLIGSNIHSDVPTSASTLLIGYVGVPVMADFHVAKRWTIKAGVEPAYRVAAGAKNGNRYVKFTKHTRKCDVMIPVAASFDITRHWVAEARANLGVRSVMEASGVNVRNLAFTLSMGYRF